MSKGRLEAFSDAVIAIAMTIMVLNLRPPAGHGFSDLRPLLPKLLVYALSFAFLAIYWNNHHHLMQAVEHIDGRVLWANMGLLFALSLTPAATAWLGPNASSTAPVVVYGLVLLLSAVAYFLLVRALLRLHPRVRAWRWRSAATARGSCPPSPTRWPLSWRSSRRGRRLRSTSALP